MCDDLKHVWVTIDASLGTFDYHQVFTFFHLLHQVAGQQCLFECAVKFFVHENDCFFLLKVSVKCTFLLYIEESIFETTLSCCAFTSQRQSPHWLQREQQFIVDRSAHTLSFPHIIELIRVNTFCWSLLEMACVKSNKVCHPWHSSLSLLNNICQLGANVLSPCLQSCFH